MGPARGTPGRATHTVKRTHTGDSVIVKVGSARAATLTPMRTGAPTIRPSAAHLQPWWCARWPGFLRESGKITIHDSLSRRGPQPKESGCPDLPVPIFPSRSSLYPVFHQVRNDRFRPVADHGVANPKALKSSQSACTPRSNASSRLAEHTDSNLQRLLDGLPFR